MNLGSIKYVNGIVTQGRGDGCGQYVSSYDILTSENGELFISKGVYSGNTSDGSNRQYSVFESTKAQFVKVIPISWNSHISMRVDALICINDDISSESTLDDTVESENTSVEEVKEVVNNTPKGKKGKKKRSGRK
jgi:hypothetical protein